MSIRHTHTLQQNTFDLQASPEPSKLLQEGKTLHQRWICPGCGITHTVMLPEECQSCGATWLEFEYAAPGSEERRH
jgi:rubrerythrin